MITSPPPRVKRKSCGGGGHPAASLPSRPGSGGGEVTGVDEFPFTSGIPDVSSLAGHTQRMPKDTSIEKILLIGSGPIVIGQACEFDYSGVQACKALQEEGYQVVLVNSNPATIMTDPEFAEPDLHRAHHSPR